MSSPVLDSLGVAPGPAGFTRSIARTGASWLDRLGFLQRRFRHRGALRILCYHGVVGDEQANEPWVPSYFVTAGQFAEHMAALTRFGDVVCLADEFNGSPDAPVSRKPRIAITFDDVAACAFRHARPILAQHGFKASFYVATGHATTGRLFDADILHWLRLRPELAVVARAMGPLLRALVTGRQCHKRLSLMQARSALDRTEPLVRQSLGREAYEALRPMSWDEIAAAAAEGHEVGGHTVDHAILGRQDATTRRNQIVDCVRDLERHLGAGPAGFAFPNGGPGDFDEIDAAILKERGVRYAGSTRAGFHDAKAYRYALPRTCIDLGHTAERFAVELSGILDGRRQRQQGWGSCHCS